MYQIQILHIINFMPVYQKQGIHFIYHFNNNIYIYIHFDSHLKHDIIDKLFKLLLYNLEY